MAKDERFDEVISTWLQETAPAQIPARVLEEAAKQTRASRQQVGWRRLLRIFHATRSILVLGATAAIMVAAVVALSPRVVQPDVGELPTTPDAWSLASIDSPWATAQVDGLVAGPRGLLAILGELGSHDMQLSVSTDARTWTLVPNDQFPSPAVLVPPSGSLSLPAVGTPNGFLFVADGNDVWASEDGYAWQRRADRARDVDLRAGTILAVAEGGPGVVAVGSDNKAWYSEDGSDWTLAEVPAPPTESFAARGYAAPTVDMTGVAVAGVTLIAWGTATAAEFAMVEPVLWTSDDGRSWEKVLDVSGVGRLQDVAAGPNGFVAIGADLTGAGGIWFSVDGRAWQPAAGFDDAGSSAEVNVSSIAATSSGYVAVGGDGVCDVEPCPDARAVIWTSPDGRSWSRLQRDDRFEVADPRTAANQSGAWATSAVARDSHFVVAGAYDASPVIWMSGVPVSPETPFVNPTHSETPALRESPSPAPRSSEQVAPPSDPAVVEAQATERLEEFLAARIAGTGAEGLVQVDTDGVPLLYATTAGAPYERYEIERVDGPRWPYGNMTFSVRLFADGDATLVEQEISWRTDGGLRLDYLSTTENGQPIVLSFASSDGEVTASAPSTWVSYWPGSAADGLATDVWFGLLGRGPGHVDGKEQIGFVDPVAYDSWCAANGGSPLLSAPADAAAIAQQVIADPDFETTAPVAARIGGLEAVSIDVALAPGGEACGIGMIEISRWIHTIGWDPGLRLRLYLVDLPDGMSVETLAISVVAPEERFEEFIGETAPIIESIEFHAP